MALSKYKSKRNFKQSPEPKGGTPGDNKLRFVIQKHDATRLHYDFRLQMKGVLKSWAVPKGPSTDPDIKRLAMMVEDHPYDYRNFEGIIPSGYGAGTVIIWDEGFYEPVEFESTDKSLQEKYLLRQLNSGKLKFTLHGKKLKGNYELIRPKGMGENAWLLFKVKDQYASAEDITSKDKSVISKKTLAQVANAGKKLFTNQPGKKSGIAIKKETKPGKENPVKKITGEKKGIRKQLIPGKPSQIKSSESSDGNMDAILQKADKGNLPAQIQPMLATLVDQPFDENGWLYEIKWDGYRALAFMNKGKISLRSRNDKSFDTKFYPVTHALQEWGINAVVDGEIVVVDSNGISNFGALQNWRSEADGELYYYVFDLLWYNSRNLLQIPLKERRAVLTTLIPQSGIIRESEIFEESGITFFNIARKMGLEGIIAKKSGSVYLPGNRSKEWLKIKANKRQEMVIGGYTKNEDTSKLFSSLLVGVFENDKLTYTGKVGTGFNTKDQQEMLKQFKPLEIKKSPFEELPDINKPSRFRPSPLHATATWLKPQLVCEVSFSEMTTDGVMRHPSFDGLRADKKAKEVIREIPKSTTKTVMETKKIAGKNIVVAPNKASRKTLLNPVDETQVKKINGHELKFTNLSKIYWPDEKISKRDMINYYYQVAPFILPYLKDRPQSMNRHPDGINGESFYYKDVTGKAPEWIETFLYHSEADNRDRKYLVAKDEASLLYMASLGCIEMNPWSNTVKKENPDWCMIDLDPANNTFDQVVEAALVTKDVLESMGVIGYPKTSGSTGMHIYIPLGAKYTYEQSKEFARIIARLVHEQTTKFTSIERTVKSRRGKMYIDFLQNRAQATISAPYSLRPKPGATVSMPLHWSEVKKGLKMKDFTIFNAIERINSEGDLFKPVLGAGINLAKITKDFERKLVEA